MPEYNVKNGSGFPNTRMRRNRQSSWIRRLVAENQLSKNDLILPLFVKEGKDSIEPIDSMPFVYRYTIDNLVKITREAKNLGIPLIALFPVVENNKKTKNGDEAYNKDNLICRAIKSIKDTVPDIGIMADVALDPYTTHGHDGIMKDNYIDNDGTIDILVKQSIVQANAGADIIAPSDMMDGRVLSIRLALDQEGLINKQIMSYSAKYCSAFYGPFRDAIKSKGALKIDKRSYQMDIRNSREALREATLDVQEGADMIMVKPGLPYLDIISKIKSQLEVPTFAYQVSGEYSSLLAASQNGWLEYQDAMLEALICFKRAGADGVLTYSAIEIAKILNKGE
tara:strand:- start:14425 stop:15441 length:1017 start_codon:yes stop_codon:yes gene_type:complete